MQRALNRTKAQSVAALQPLRGLGVIVDFHAGAHAHLRAKGQSSHRVSGALILGHAPLCQNTEIRNPLMKNDVVLLYNICIHPLMHFKAHLDYH